MNSRLNDLSNFHCPRWDQLPAIPLYMDQVVLVLEDALGLFAEKPSALIKPTMINNYVKHKLVSPPNKKKYAREQMAQLGMVSLFKLVFSMDEIRTLLAALQDEMGLPQAYDAFCQGLDSGLMQALVDRQIHFEAQTGGAQALLSTAILALTGKLLTQNALAAWQTPCGEPEPATP